MKCQSCLKSVKRKGLCKDCLIKRIAKRTKAYRYDFEDEIDRRLKGTGRALSPTFAKGRITTHNSVESFNERSKQALDAVNAKYGRPFRQPVSYSVDGQLRVHSD